MRIFEEKVSFQELSDYLNDLCDGKANRSVLNWIKSKSEDDYYIYYMDKNGDFYSNSIEVIRPYEVVYDDNSYIAEDDYSDKDDDYYFFDEKVHVLTKKESKEMASYQVQDYWREVDRIDLSARLLNSKKSILSFIKNNKPYLYNIAKESKNPEYFLINPWLEQLYKSGYAFSKKIVNNADTTDFLHFYALTGKGTNIKRIIRTERPVYELLKDEKDLYVWYAVSNLYKKKILTKEELPVLYAQGYTNNELNKVCSILSDIHITLEGLIRLLNRSMKIDYESRSSEIMLLHDYIVLCKKNNECPNMSYGSIRKRHDKYVITCKMRYDKKLEDGIRESWIRSRRFDYVSGDFFIRSVKSVADLQDEAKQQHSCVFEAYGEKIATGETMIFFMRSKESPEKSLVTVELGNGTIKQAYLGKNRTVTNKAQLNFLRMWEKHVNKILLCERKKKAS